MVLTDSIQGTNNEQRRKKKDKHTNHTYAYISFARYVNLLVNKQSLQLTVMFKNPSYMSKIYYKIS